MTFLELSAINLLIWFLGLLLLTIYMFGKKDNVKLPPGPRGMPVFGSLLSIANANHPGKVLFEMAKDYGSVMTVRLGSRIGIVLTGYDRIKEALVDNAEDFSARPLLPVWEKAERDKGLLFATQWRERRRVALTSMRDFGLGKRSLDERMYEEAEMLVQELEKSNGRNFILHNLMPVVTTNIICSIIRAERFPYGSDVMKNMVSSFEVLIGKTELSNTENYVQWVNYIPFLNRTTWENERDADFKKVSTLIQSWIDEHKKTFDNENIRDLIDHLLSQSRKGDSSCTDENILPICWDLFAAGTETTSTTLLWSIAYLIVHTDIQIKCRNEIYEVVGTERHPQFSDSTKLPYLNAVINEVQRMGSIAPLGFMHTVNDRVDLAGYTIPKGSLVIANLDSALKDTKYWGDPHTFRPERWLDAEGQLMKNQAHIPFSIGKRECLGKNLAKKEVFIFLSSMLQGFKFELADGTNPPNLDKGAGQIRTAPKYVVRVHKM